MGGMGSGRPRLPLPKLDIALAYMDGARVTTLAGRYGCSRFTIRGRLKPGLFR